MSHVAGQAGLPSVYGSKSMIIAGEQVLERVRDALDRGDLDAGAADAVGVASCTKLS